MSTRLCTSSARSAFATAGSGTLTCIAAASLASQYRPTEARAAAYVASSSVNAFSGAGAASQATYTVRCVPAAIRYVTGRGARSL